MIPNPWVILGLVFAWLASLGAVGYWQNDAGHVAERVSCLADKNAALKAAGDDLKKHIANEHDLETKLAQAGVDHAEEMGKVQDQHDADVASAYAGGLRLRVPGTCVSSSPGAGGTPSPGDGHGSAACELPAAAVADLFALADDADRNTVQLAACQAVVRAYQEAHP